MWSFLLIEFSSGKSKCLPSAVIATNILVKPSSEKHHRVLGDFVFATETFPISVGELECSHSKQIQAKITAFNIIQLVKEDAYKV